MKIYQVDAFTDKPFTGNPAGVCLLPAPRDDAWMQAVAREMNLAEILQKESWRRGVEVALQDGQIVIDLYLILEYGLRLSEVAHNIMSAVKYGVEKALGVPVGAVNVHIQSIRMSG